MPKASLDINNPGSLENVIIRQIEKLGVGIYPNDALKVEDVINKLAAIRKRIVDDARNNPESLMQWLYENQSPRLFGAENRLFVVLVDSTDMEQSWRMKRAFSLIEPKVNSYLDTFNALSLKKIYFTFNKKSYESLADIIFVVKE